MRKRTRAAGSGPLQNLSRRERQIMEVIYRAERATAAEVHEALPDAPSATAVRTMLRNLEAKGHLGHVQDGPRHVYFPTTPQSEARRSALRGLVATFFGGSSKEALAELLDLSQRGLTDAERAELEAMIRASRAQGD